MFVCFNLTIYIYTIITYSISNPLDRHERSNLVAVKNFLQTSSTLRTIQNSLTKLVSSRTEFNSCRKFTQNWHWTRIDLCLCTENSKTKGMGLTNRVKGIGRNGQNFGLDSGSRWTIGGPAIKGATCPRRYPYLPALLSSGKPGVNNRNKTIK